MSNAGCRVVGATLSVACRGVVRLKPLDVAFLRAIHQKVNVVPVIAKADTLTKSELGRLKHTVRHTVCVVTASVTWPDDSHYQHCLLYVTLSVS